MEDWHSLQEKVKTYLEKQRAFAKSHKPRRCDNCGAVIEPGADVIVDANHVFCDYDCFGVYQGAERLAFNDDDDEYKSLFEKREDGK